MHTAKLRAWLLEALVAGTAVTTGCTRSPDVTPEPAHPNGPDGANTVTQVDVARPPANPTTSSPAAGPATASPAAATPPAANAAQAPATLSYKTPQDKTGACVDGRRNILSDLKPTHPVDYLELRMSPGDGPGKPLLAHGTPCASASNAAACQQAFSEAAPKGFGAACRPGMCSYHLIVTDSKGARKLVSPADILGFTGPIDTPSEALLAVFANNHEVLGCNVTAPTRVGKNWQVSANLVIADCPMVKADVTFAVSEAGAVSIVSTKNQQKSNVCVGRRPPDLVAQDSAAHARQASYAGASSTAIAEYLAASAYLEAASVPAFERVAEELQALGAPQELAGLCKKAADDERRHAAVMGGLAVVHGAHSPQAVVSGAPRRSALELALDNAVEGCVRETFGALVGLHQAATARDADVRAAMQTIAEDEIRHAALAWKIASWLTPQLSEQEARLVEQAQADAIGALKAELASDPELALQTALGLPSAGAARAMLQTLETTLWS